MAVTCRKNTRERERQREKWPRVRRTKAREGSGGAFVGILVERNIAHLLPERPLLITNRHRKKVALKMPMRATGVHLREVF